MSLKELARSVITDREHVVPELQMSHSTFVEADSMQSDDVVARRFDRGRDLTRFEIERFHREIATHLVPAGIAGVVQNPDERDAGIVSARLYGAPDATLAQALKDVPGVDDGLPPRNLGERAVWIRDLVLPAIRSGEFDPSKVTEWTSRGTTVESVRGEMDRKGIEVDFAMAMKKGHRESYEARYDGVKLPEIQGESSHETSRRITTNRVERDAWRRDLSIARGVEPEWSQYDVARSEYSRLVAPDLATGVPDDARSSSHSGIRGRAFDAIERDPRRVAWEAREQDRMLDRSTLVAARQRTDLEGRRPGGPTSVLRNLGTRMDLVTMFDPADGVVSKSLVGDLARARSDRATGGKGPVVSLVAEQQRLASFKGTVER